MEVDGGRLTPLDYAIIGGHQDVAQLLIENGALSISGIQDLAAIVIQKRVRGFLVRRKYAGVLSGLKKTDKEEKAVAVVAPEQQQQGEKVSTSLTSSAQDVGVDSGHDRRRYECMPPIDSTGCAKRGLG